MDEVDKLVLLADLGQTPCELNHGPATKKEDFPATNYITIPMGFKENGVVENAVREMVIPICDECMKGLQSKLWTLLYCFECTSSQWIYRPLAKMAYRHDIIWLRGCPDCGGKFGGVYFNDNDILHSVANMLM
jgi:hypothetical protein